MRYLVHSITTGEKKDFDWPIDAGMIHAQKFSCNCGGEIRCQTQDIFQCNRCKGVLRINAMHEPRASYAELPDSDLSVRDIGCCELIGYAPEKVFTYTI